MGDVVHLGFRQDLAGGGGEFGLGESVDLVALDNPDAAQAGQAERFAEVVQEVARLSVVGGLFFNEDAVHQRRNLGSAGW